MDVILNIGLKSAARGNIDSGAALRECINRFGTAAMVLHESDTELTAVVMTSLPDFGGHGLVRQLAAALGQEVIACWKVGRNKGVMLGATIDLDDAWGDFDPALFLMPDGTRLSDRNPAAKAA